MDNLKEKTVHILNFNEYNNMIVEMARINKNENNGVFPFNSFEVKIWSNDHNPPHFHVIKDGWNIGICIENGKVEKIESKGKSEQVYNYIVENAPKWLEEKCAIKPKLSNRENAELIWAQIIEND